MKAYFLSNTEFEKFQNDFTAKKIQTVLKSSEKTEKISGVIQKELANFQFAKETLKFSQRIIEIVPENNTVPDMVAAICGITVYFVSRIILINGTKAYKLLENNLNLKTSSNPEQYQKFITMLATRFVEKLPSAFLIDKPADFDLLTKYVLKRAITGDDVGTIGAALWIVFGAPLYPALSLKNGCGGMSIKTYMYK